jgi:hypothetical protein
MEELFIEYTTTTDQFRLGFLYVLESRFCKILSHSCPPDIQGHLRLVHPTSQDYFSPVFKVKPRETPQRQRTEMVTSCDTFI